MWRTGVAGDGLYNCLPVFYEIVVHRCAVVKPFLESELSENGLATAYSASQNTAGNPRREQQS